MSDQEKPNPETVEPETIEIVEPDTAEVAAVEAAKEKSEAVEDEAAESQADDEESVDEEANEEEADDEDEEDDDDEDDDIDDEDDDDVDDDVDDEEEAVEVHAADDKADAEESEEDDEEEDDDDVADDDDDVDHEEEAEAEEQAADERSVTAEPVAAMAAGAAAGKAVEGAVTDVVSPDHAQHLRLLEALVFAGTQALDEKELADRLPNDADVKRLIADLTEMYAGRGVNLMQVAGGWAFRTAPDLSEKLKIERPVNRKLSRAAVETLAIIAYHQPVTRAEIEQVRGVGLSKGTLDLLFEQNWIKPMGRRRAPGKPVTWGTSDFFLEHFGLPSLDDLPGQEELKAAGLLDPRSQPPIFRPEEPDLPLEPGEDEADEPLAVDETGR
jgi:segregation and condensation protein B